MYHLCTTWSTTDVQWSDSNWTWDECQLVKEICAVWGETDAFWKNANWKWSGCNSGTMPPEPPVGNVFISPGIDANTVVQSWLYPDEPWDAYKELKRKRLIKLIFKIKGKNFEEEKQIKKFNVSVDDIKMVVKKVANVELTIQE